MKYDCSKILDYVHEWYRMCNAVFYKGCDNCPTKNAGECCYHIRFITQKHIDIIQKWSDDHPEKTRADVFFEMFPDAVWQGIDKKIPVTCYRHLINIDNNYLCQENYKCKKCWLQPYNGEFEKARKEKNE